MAQHPLAFPPKNHGFSVARVDPYNKTSLWTIVDDQGRSLDTVSLAYTFFLKREAQAYLQEHDVAAELAERQRQEQERMVERKRSELVRAHPLYGEYLILRAEAEALNHTLTRLGQRIERHKRTSLDDVLQDVHALLTEARTIAHEAAQERLHIIYQDVKNTEATTNG